MRVGKSFSPEFMGRINSVQIKQNYCVIGCPIKHSLSPKIYNRAFKKYRIPARYEAAEVNPKNLAAFMSTFRTKYSGASVTIPHKQAVIKFLDQLSPEARAIGAVNCIVNRDGELTGYNTDSDGAMQALRKGASRQMACTPGKIGQPGKSVGVSGHIHLDKWLHGKHAIVLGAGGAARAVVYGLRQAGAEVLVVNRTLSHAKKLAANFGCKACSLAEFTLSSVKRKFPFDILVNTTSVGMWPNAAATPLPDFAKILASAARTSSKKVRSGTTALQRSSMLANKTKAHASACVVMDIIYRPRMTRFLKDAQRAGCHVITGEAMFLAQAEKSFELWTARRPRFVKM